MTRSGTVATKYPTPRFILVPALRDHLAVAVPADCGPGKPWSAGSEITPAAQEPVGPPIRIGCARCNTATQEPASQLETLTRANCTRVFSDQISSTAANSV